MRLPALAEPAEVAPIADEVLAHRFRILGLTIETGPEIRWRRDPLSGIETGLAYFRRIPYLDAPRAGDHKIIWELNRHQHWVVLAQAALLTGRRAYRDEIWRQYESWVRQNPFQRGINWASALEVAFRALSWMWVYHLTGGEAPAGFLTELYRHGLHLERNLSVYFSPNTHLLGEAVALHALGLMFSNRRWAAAGGRIVRQEMERQVRGDGSHFEQSSYYHVYALDMFRFHAALAGADDAYRARLGRMEEFLDALMGPQRMLPLLGDDDGGRFLGGAEPRGLKPAPQSRLFPDAGLAVMVADDMHVIVDAGPFGAGSAGHSHSDTLSVVARAGDREILIDPGTYTYVADPAERERFRGSAAHNTVRIDGLDQATPAGPFRWAGRPGVRIFEWTTTPECDLIDAECSYSGFTHRRKVVFRKRARQLEIADTITGPRGDHTIEQFWHLAGVLDAVRTSYPAERIEGWRSRVFGSKEPAPVLRVTKRGGLPMHLSAVVSLRAR